MILYTFSFKGDCNLFRFSFKGKKNFRNTKEKGGRKSGFLLSFHILFCFLIKVFLSFILCIILCIIQPLLKSGEGQRKNMNNVNSTYIYLCIHMCYICMHIFIFRQIRHEQLAKIQHKANNKDKYALLYMYIYIQIVYIKGMKVYIGDIRFVSVYYRYVYPP